MKIAILLAVIFILASFASKAQVTSDTNSKKQYKEMGDALFIKTITPKLYIYQNP